MKKTFLFLGISAMLFVGCAKDEPSTVGNEQALTEPAADNKLLLLKYNSITDEFMGGKELVFDDAESFSISTAYSPVTEGGTFSLAYAETGQPILAGTMVWGQYGERTYPEDLDAPQSFETTEEAVEMPSLENWEVVEYYGEDFYHAVPYETMWDRIDNLQKVREFRESNPDSKIYLVMHPVALGVENPTEAPWYIMIKN